MARNPSESLTEREAQIMGVIWQHGEATAEQVRGALPGRPHDSTVRTMLRILVRKGYLRREAVGKAHSYRAAVARSAAQRTALRGLLRRLFAGSAEDLVLRLIEDEQLTPAQLDELRRTRPEGRKKGGKRR
jgi:predicted transcriptional regulator